MSKIFQMQSFPILNVTDFYKHFDVLDMLRNKEALGRFVKGHFQWGSSNRHHIDVILAMINPDMSFQMACAQDYWGFGGDEDNKEEFPAYERQARTAEAVYQKYSGGWKDQDSKIMMLIIAGLLLAEKEESCLNQISWEQLKKAYDGAKKAPSVKTGENEAVAEISLTDPKKSVMLHSFDGVYRFKMDTSLKPSYEKRMETYMIRTDADVTLEMTDLATGTARQKKLSEGDRLHCLVLEGKILKLLPDSVSNGRNTITRRRDGIYINGVKHPEIPADASSFAVSADEENPQYIYVEQGHIHYGNYDDFNGRGRVPEEIAVISQVSMKGSMAMILRNDGKYWDGRKFC